MKKPLDDKQMRCYLSAFADGELDVEQSLQVLERMAMDPQMTRRVLHQQQLRQRVAQTMGNEKLKTPDALKQQIMASARQSSSPQQAANAARRNRWSLVQRWLPTTIAAALLLTALLTVQFGSGGGARPGLTEYAGMNGSDTAAVVNLASADRFGRRHVRCSRDITPLFNTDRFPDQVTALPRSIEGLLGKKFTGPPLDLSLLGYEYQQAGECLIPGSRSVHVLYRAADGSGRSDSLSLWITAENTDLDLEPGRLYTAVDDEKPHPLLIWRHEELTYYLVGDSMPRVHQVAQAMASR
ncbi:anti-sigma factor [Phycisphaerales bacterium AB-hyl4]|uniref:Anti-sigma factor n=1 Tax=Natronomicrosphaera hydrolytica TaxID=3242702 RepID=A0ABV4U722_9BACT